MTESTGSVGLAPVTTQDLKIKEAGLGDLAQMLTDPSRIESLMMVTKYYRDFFDDFWFACYQLSTYKDITYLIDFDVLREYLEVDSVQHFGSLILDTLFSPESDKMYAIPAGALNELLDYVRTLSRTTGGISRLDFHKPTDFGRQIAAFMQIKDANKAEFEDLSERTMEVLTNTSVRLKRLHEILTNPRFLGVVSSYEQDDVKRLEAILDRMPRTRDTARSKKDHRDAINLAIAINSIRGQESTRKKSGYMLLTNTKIVQKLPRMILEHVENSDQRSALLDELGAILGLVEEDKRVSTPAGPDFSLDFPAMHPSLVINAELQGVFDNSALIMSKVEKLQNEYQKVNNFLRAQVTTGVKGASPSTSTMIPELSEEVAQSLKEIATEMLSVRARGAMRVEQRRATAVSVAYNRQEQKGKPVTIHDELTQESTNLLKWFGKVLAAIEGAAGFKYKIQEEAANDSRPFGLFRVLQEPAPNGHEPLAAGEKYPLELSDSKPAFFTMRWPVVCRAERFLNAMRRLIIPMVRDEDASAQPAKRGFSLKRMGDPELLNQGVIIFANDRAFGCRLDIIVKSNEWDKLNLRNISPMVKKLLDEDSLSQGHHTSVTPRVQQYRVNTTFGDFMFDIESAEDESRRYLTIMSHYNMARQVALLYRYTGQLYIFPEKLANDLAPLLADFQTPPDNRL